MATQLFQQANAYSYSELVRYDFEGLNPRSKGLYEAFIKYNSVLEHIKTVRSQSLLTKFQQRTNASNKMKWGPQANSVQDSAGPKNPPRQMEEAKYRMQNFWNEEKYIVDASGASPEAFFDKVVGPEISYFAYDLNARIFNNHHDGTNADGFREKECFIGLRQRVKNAGSSTVADNPWFVPGEMRKDLSAINLATTGSSLASATNELMRQIELQLKAMGNPNGDGIVIAAGEHIQSLINSGLRALGSGGGWELTKDNFDRSVVKYKNATLFDPGRTAPADDLGTQYPVLRNDEGADGKAWFASSGKSASVFIIDTSEDKLVMEEFYTDPLTDPFLDGTTQSIYRVKFEQLYGLTMFNPRAVAQLYGIQVQP